MIRLEARGLSKTFGSFTAVKNVSLDFAPGQIHAVLGENGAGKSTLMKLLFGLEKPTAGEIVMDGRAVSWRSSLDAISHGLGMVQQHFTLVEPLSVIDNIMFGAETCDRLSGVLDRKQAIEILEKRLPTRSLALPWYEKVANLSVGEKQRLEILKLLFRDSRILFLDEPTAVLTPAEIEEFFAVLRELKAQGRTIVLITHKINEVLQVCDTYAVLRHGELRAKGQVAGASVDEIVESLIGRKLQEFSLGLQTARRECVFSCDGLSDAAKRLRGVKLSVYAGEIVGIAGVEGAGQSQLVDLLMGLEKGHGQLEILGDSVESTHSVRARGVGLIPEDRLAQGLWSEESCAHNMAIGLEERFFKNHLLQEDVLSEAASEWAKAFDLRAANLNVAAGSLSGGNQQKIIFAREVLGRNPRFLICHQPTRGVDLGAIDLIHRKLVELRNSGLGVLLISSELDELLKLCDRLYVFFSGEISLELKREEFDRARIGEAMTGVRRAL